MNLKIAEISASKDPFMNSEISELRKKFWQEKLSDCFQVEWVQAEPDDFQKWLKENQDFNAILFSEQYSIGPLKFLREIPTEVKNILVADSIVKELGHYIPRILLKEALRLQITERHPLLDTQGVVYVTGSEQMIRPAVAVAVQLGFSKIHLVDANVDALMEHAEFLRKKYFGINFLLIKDSELTLQPGNGTLLLNTISIASQKPLLEDISYMNFLKKDALIADIPFARGTNLIAEEAGSIGIALISSVDLQAYRDYELLKKFEIKNLPQKSEYCSLWSEFLKQDKGPVT